MKFIKLALFCAITLMSSVAYAQTPALFTNFYGDQDDNRFYDCVYDANRDWFYNVGRSKTTEPVLSVTDACGVLLFSREYTYAGLTNLTKIVQAPNGEFLLLGNANEDFIVIRVDPGGSIIWMNRYHQARERGGDIVRSFGDNYIISGWETPSGTSDDVVVFSIDAGGAITNQRRYHLTDDQPMAMCTNGNGGAIITGGLHGGGINMFLMEVDNTCALVQTMRYSETGGMFNESIDIIQTISGDYAILGRTRPSTSANWSSTLKLVDPAFGLIWEQQISTPDNNLPKNLSQDINEDLYISYKSTLGGTGNNDATISKFDIGGGYITTETYKLIDELRVRLFNLGGPDALLHGFTGSQPPSFGGNDANLFRTDWTLQNCLSQTVMPNVNALSWNITSPGWSQVGSNIVAIQLNVPDPDVKWSYEWYCETFKSAVAESTLGKGKSAITSKVNVTPNPARDMAQISVTPAADGMGSISVYDFNGREIAVLFTGEMIEGVTQNVNFNTADLEAGVYIYKYINGDELITGRIVIAK